MTPPLIMTGSWSDTLPAFCQRIGISRGQPRSGSGYKVYRALAPGPWFNSCEPDEYYRRYHGEILSLTTPRGVADDLARMCGGLTPVLLCFERADQNTWCHRAMVAEWLSAGLGYEVQEFVSPTKPGCKHPLMPEQLHSRPQTR